MGHLELQTDATVEPVTLAELKTQLRVSGSSEDDLLTGLITAARQIVEAYTHRALITQTWDYIISNPGSVIRIPMPPLQSVTSITSYDLDNDSTDEGTSKWYTVTNTTPGEIRLNNGETWASVIRDNGFVIEFKCGYGAAASAVPGSLVTAVKMIASALYENRGDSADSNTDRIIKYSGAAPVMQRYIYMVS